MSCKWLDSESAKSRSLNSDGQAGNWHTSPECLGLGLEIIGLGRTVLGLSSGLASQGARSTAGSHGAGDSEWEPETVTDASRVFQTDLARMLKYGADIRCQ